MKPINPPTIVRSSPPRKGAAASSLKIRRILVPVDFSEAGKPAQRYAKGLARLTGASICLVHVMERIYSAGTTYPGPRFDYIQLDTDEMRERVSRELGALQAGIFRGIKTTFEIREGSAFHEIVATAADVKADLIVLATHGYTGLQHIVMGSTTERVVRHATCPVLVVRSEVSAKGEPPARRSSARPHQRKQP